MTNAVIYARYSSHNQTEQSIEGQLSAAHKYAQEHGYNVVHEYCDRAKTGTNDNRDEFQKMLRDSSKHGFDVVILWKVDRFGRNREEIAFNKYKLKKNNVRIEYVAENISNGPEGVILESVLEGMAEYYSLQLSQNIRRGRLESAKKHKVLNGHCPLGYKKDVESFYIIDSEASNIVKEIFNKYAEGMSMADLTKWLNNKGYRTSMNQPFTKNSLPRILKNDMYIGTYRYAGVICDEDAIPAIISKELFYRVQDMLKVNKRMPSRHWEYNDYVLTGKVFCGYCESAMIGVSGHGKLGVKYNYYGCPKRRQRLCTKHYVNKNELENVVINYIKEFLDNETIFEQIVDATWNYYLNNDYDENQTNVLNIKKDKLMRSRNNLVKAVEEGMPYSLVQPKLEEIEKDLDEIDKQLAEIQINSPMITKDSIELFLNRLRTGDYENPKIQKQLIETFINKIYVFDDKITLILNTSNDNTVDVKLSEINESSGVLPLLLNWSYAHNSRTSVWRTYIIVEILF